MKKLTFAMLIITGALFLGLGSSSKSLMADTPTNAESETRGKYLNIMTVNKMQSNMIKELTGDKHSVNYMFNSEKDINEYKVTDEAVQNISNMDLFFYSGNNFEPWINDLTGKLNKNVVSIEDLSRGIREDFYTGKEKNKVNPYYWTSISNYKIMLYNAKSLLQENDPANRNFYEENYNKMIEKLDKANLEFKNVKGLDKITFVVRDDKFSYFLNSIGIKYTVLKENEDIDEFIKTQNLKEEDVILIKDKSVKKEENDGEVKVVNLESYNSNKTYEAIIIDNLKELEKLTIKK